MIKVITTALFLVCLNILNTGAQCLKSEQEYKDYYEKNIVNLDPIEGIWDVSYKFNRYDDGNLVNVEENQKRYNAYIIRYGDKFYSCGIPELVTTTKITFKKTASDNVYLYDKITSAEVWQNNSKYKATAILKNNLLLEYSYKIEYEDKKRILWDDIVSTYPDGTQKPATD